MKSVEWGPLEGNFWCDIKTFIINAVNYAFEHQRLPISQRLGIVSIIPKGDKDKRFLTNWRPLTLLNTLYKIISGCIAERIKPILNDIIHPDQKGFVAGRYIGEAIRTTFDTLHYAKANNLPGLLLTIDFQKAYDSINFGFIIKCLKFFNFSSDIITWVRILLSDFKAVVNHCGNIGDSFNIERGCRQGDPFASYLFILCIEILAHKLRTDPGVKGFDFMINDKDNPNDSLTHLLEIYADDLSVFMSPSEENLQAVIEILNRFYMVSGLKISATKTKAVWFGSKIGCGERLCPGLGLQWVSSFTLLGVEFDSSLTLMHSNFTNKLAKMERMLSSWAYRYMTPYGRVTIIKSLGLSMLSHLALVLPNPSKYDIKKIESSLFRFLWEGKPDKIRRDDSKLHQKQGGIGMPDVANFWTAFKFS